MIPSAVSHGSRVGSGVTVGGDAVGVGDGGCDVAVGNGVGVDVFFVSIEATGESGGPVSLWAGVQTVRVTDNPKRPKQIRSFLLHSLRINRRS